MYKRLNPEQRYTIDVLLQQNENKDFFALPYSAWRKGCIEYYNKLVRQYIPKGIDFNDIPGQMEIIIKVNKRPGMKLAFSIPAAEFFKFIASFLHLQVESALAELFPEVYS